MKIVIVGTSPIMIILAIALSKKNKVTLFEKRKNFGGAWSFFKYKSMYIHNKTNVIVPTKKSEEKHIKNIIKYLKKKFNLKIRRNKKIYKTVSKYKPKNIFIYDIHKIYDHLKKFNIKIINKNVTNISISKKKVFINNFEFDKVFIPTFIALKKVKIDKNFYYFNFKKIISKHLVLISKKKFLKEFYYMENFNNYFDRALLKRRKSLYLFTARIKKRFKHFKHKELIKLSNFGIEKKNLLLSKIFKYENCYRDDSQIKKLNNLNKFKKIKVVDTTQFVSSFKKLKFKAN